MQKRTAALLAAATVAAGLLGAFLIKEPCTRNAWEDNFQYRHYCYSDILPLYYRFHLHDEPDPRFPYTISLEELQGTAVEYPPVTIAFAWLVAKGTTGLAAYMTVTAVLLLACAAVAAYAMWRSGVEWHRIAFWGLAPPLVIHGLTNWDLLAVAFAAGGWWAWSSGRPFAAAALFGLGGAAKVYPAFFLPYLALAAFLRPRHGTAEVTTLATRDWRTVVQVGLGGLVGLVGPNLWAWLATPRAWMDVWLFHAKREPDWETPYEVLREWLGGADTAAWHDAVSRGSLLALVAVGLLLAVAMWRRRLDPLVAGSLAVVAFLLVNRVYSPQYTLWALPILLALRAPWVPLGIFVAADLAVFVLRYPLIAEWHAGDDPTLVWHRVSVTVRWLALATCGAVVAARAGLFPWGPRRPARATHAGEPPPAAESRAARPQPPDPARPDAPGVPADAPKGP